MIRLTYISTAKRGLADAEVFALLEGARPRNRARGITGMLLFDGVRFLQALEGDADIITETFTRIKADPRHRACVELNRVEITERAFSNWDMAWQRVNSGDGETLKDRVDAMVAEVPDPSLRALFTSFARIDRHAVV